jgi:hypothetical protein
MPGTRVANQNGYRITPTHGGFKLMYFLVDNIYGRLPWLMKGEPILGEGPIFEDKRKMFEKDVESARKDVECAIGAVQARFKMVRKGHRLEYSWDDDCLNEMIYFAVLLHNMILDLYGYARAENNANGVPMSTEAMVGEFDEELSDDEHKWEHLPPPEELRENVLEALNEGEHFRLRNALIALR